MEVSAGKLERVEGGVIGCSLGERVKPLRGLWLYG
jgi:hypothetical protein